MDESQLREQLCFAVSGPRISICVVDGWRVGLAYRSGRGGRPAETPIRHQPFNDRLRSLWGTQVASRVKMGTGTKSSRSYQRQTASGRSRPEH